MTRDLSRWTPAPAPVASTASSSDGPDERRGPRVAAAVLLLAGPVELLVCEAVAASAWTDPPYSYVRNVLSDLAVPARHTFFQGRPIESPLHALMNASFGVFGPLVLVAAVIVTSPLPGRTRRPVRSLALASTLANVLVSLVPETTVAPLHGTGAFLSFLCGNALVVVLAVQTRALGLPAGVRVTLLTLGCIGLAALLVLVTIPALYSGALERFIAYPYLAALLVLGTSILPRRRHASRDRGTGRAGHRPRGCTATSAALTANHSRSPGSASSSATADGVTSADRPSAPPRRPGPSCAEGLRTDDPVRGRSSPAGAGRPVISSLGTGVRAFAAHDHPGPGRVAGQHLGWEQGGDLGQTGAVAVAAVRIDGVDPDALRDDLMASRSRLVMCQPTENEQLTLVSCSPRGWCRKSLEQPAPSARTRIGLP